MPRRAPTLVSSRRLVALARRAIGINRGLRMDPADECVELQRLFGGNQSVGVRKSVLTGGLSRSAGGSG